MNQSQIGSNATPVTQRWGRFLMGLVVIVIVWCGVLPWIAVQPAMVRQLEFLDEKGIDPSAMFYTELDAMDSILRQSNHLRPSSRRDPTNGATQVP